jgi:hypothetical protein
MLKKIGRQRCLDKYPSFPQVRYDKQKEEYVHSFPETFGGCILTVSSKSFRGHLSLIGKGFVSLLRQMEIDRLIFLGDSDLPWIAHKNTHPPVKAAHDFLSQNGVGEKFNGAIMVGLNSLPAFIRIVGWLTRGNAFSQFYSMDEKQTFFASICKYGNIHMDTLNKNIEDSLGPMISNTSLEILVDGHCHDSFSKTGRIPGRKATYLI